MESNIRKKFGGYLLSCYVVENNRDGPTLMVHNTVKMEMIIITQSQEMLLTGILAKIHN